MPAGGQYQYTGYSQPEVQYKGNAVKTTAAGKRKITFRDGTVIDITYPKYYLRGEPYPTIMPVYTALLRLASDLFPCPVF